MDTVIDIAEAVRSGQRKAKDIVEECFKQIKKKNKEINAFIFLNEKEAYRIADKIDKRVEKGEDPGPLAGVPFGVKDLNHCSGMPSTYGSYFYKDAPPSKNDDLFIARLRTHGAIPVGMVAASEFGLDSATHTTLWGVTRNPWNLNKTPGGSSGGSSAAVSAGMVPFCTGGDAAGSIRSPAAFTGLVGLKPSTGRIPSESGFDDLDCNGVITSTVADTARLLDIMAGPDPRDRRTLPKPNIRYEDAIENLDVKGLRAVWSADYGYASVEDEVAEIAGAAADKLISAAGLIRLDTGFNPPNITRHWMKTIVHKIKIGFHLMGVLPDNMDKLSPNIQFLLDRETDISDEDIYTANKVFQTIEAPVAELFRETDILLSPTTACRAYDADATMLTTINGNEAPAEPFGLVANACWNPSISVPAGLTSDGLPVGLMITARRHQDEIPLRLARILEQISPWPRTAPGY